MKMYKNYLYDDEDVVIGGRLLRSSGVDELPQLLNVIYGSMSLVGPRPLPLDYESKITTSIRSMTKPGITGLVQVKGDNSLTWKIRFEMDEFYVKNASFMLDLKIILKTVLVVFSGRKVKSSPLG